MADFARTLERELAEAKVKAFEDGKAAQAILELRARDKFIAELKKEIKDDRTQLRVQLEAATRELNRVHDTLTRFGMGLDGPYRKSINPVDGRYIADRVVALCDSRESANRDAAAMRDARDTLAAFAQTAPGRIPQAVQDAIAPSSPSGKDYARRDVLEMCADAITKGIEHPNWHFEVACGGREALTAARAELGKP